MIRFTVRVIASCTEAASKLQKEVILFTNESNDYNPLELDNLIKDALDSSRKAASVESLEMLALLKPELSLQLLADEEPIRGALHLSAETVRTLAAAGASIDFDPYIYS